MVYACFKKSEVRLMLFTKFLVITVLSNDGYLKKLRETAHMLLLMNQKKYGQLVVVFVLEKQKLWLHVSGNKPNCEVLGNQRWLRGADANEPLNLEKRLRMGPGRRSIGTMVRRKRSE